MKVVERIAAQRRLPGRRPHSTPGPEVRLGLLAGSGRGFNNFDLLRLTAAILVVFGHSFDLAMRPEPLTGALGVSWGQVGVLIFFSVSGFLVARSWAGEPRLLPFALKRVLRLMPALAVVLLLTALVLGPLVTAKPARSYLADPGTRDYILSNVALQSDWNLPGVFMHNAYPFAVNGSLWTLPLEVKAYVLVALVGMLGLLCGKRRWLLLGVSAYAVVVAIPHMVSRVPGGANFVAALVNSQMPASVLAAARTGAFEPYTTVFAAFAIGMAAYALRSRITLHWRYAALGLLAFAAVTRVGGSEPGITLSIVVPYIVLCLAYRTTSIVRLPRRLGDLSYGMYLYAFPVQQTISYLLAPRSGWVLFVLALPVTSLLAAASWHVIERPALRLKRRLTDSRDALPEMPAVPDQVATTETPPLAVRSHV